MATHFAKNVRGRHFIVTGGYGGIGVETVKALLVAGGRVTVAARSDATRRVRGRNADVNLRRQKQWQSSGRHCR